jgi:hypothetical protein
MQLLLRLLSLMQLGRGAACWWRIIVAEPTASLHYMLCQYYFRHCAITAAKSCVRTCSIPLDYFTFSIN